MEKEHLDTLRQVRQAGIIAVDKRLAKIYDDRIREQYPEEELEPLPWELADVKKTLKTRVKEAVVPSTASKTDTPQTPVSPASTDPKAKKAPQKKTETTTKKDGDI